MGINPNWPLLEYGAGLRWGATGGDSPRDLYVDVSNRTEGAHTVSRGRQYELDQVQAGTYSGELANKDGALDPANASSPFAGRIQPFQPFRVRAMWPPSVNLLTQGIASGGDTGGIPLGPIVTSRDLDVYTETDPANGSVVTSGTAFQGSTVLQHSVPSGTAAAKRIAHTFQVAVVPGAPYAFQMQVRNVTAGTSLQVKAFLGWFTVASGTPSSYSYGSTVTLTGSATAAWTQVTVTGTAPVNTYGIDVGVAVAATASATCSIQSDAWQQEQNATVSAWVLPGVWYPVAAQFTERWISQWSRSGTYGTVLPSASDAFSLLSQKQISDPLTEEINRHSPRFLFKLDDPQGSELVAEATGQFAPAPVKHGKYGAGTVTFGTSITAADPVGGIFTGSAGTVLNLVNVSPATNLLAAASYLSFDTVGIRGPADPLGAWSRMLAFRWGGSTTRTSDTVMWSSFDARRPTLVNGMAFKITTGGLFSVVLSSPAGATETDHTYSGRVDDGNWHLAIVEYDPALDRFIVGIDDAYNSQDGYGAAGLIPAAGTLVSDSFGGYVDVSNGGGTTFNWTGDLAYAAEFPVALTGTDREALYLAWKNSLTGDSTGTRYARILGYAGYLGPRSIQSGLTTSMGPLVGGSDALSSLQQVVDTEAGTHYVSTDGTVTFKSRSTRYNALTPAYTFGEDVAAGEFPYEDVQLDYDATHLGNQVTVTQTSTGQQFNAQDSASMNAYFPRSLTREVNSSDPYECQDAANYLLSRYKLPATRVSSIKLHPSANPALWPVCLSLELGTRARIMRRPPGVPATQLEVFIEKIDWSFDNSGEAWCTLQCSPVDLAPYGIFAAWHTTLAAASSAGATTITVNAGQDNTNPLGTQLAAGQQLTLGQNTPNQETVTVQSVGATSPGWTTATITLTAATTTSHAVGDLINEPLPAGVTDPTTWDAASAFDAVVFAY